MLFLYMGSLEEEERLVFQDLYEENIDFFLNYAKQFVKDKTKAQEAVHEAFVYLLKNKKKYLRPEKEQMKKLTTTIIRGKAIDLLRQEGKFTKEGFEDLEIFIQDPGPGPEEELIEKEDIKKLRRALASLDQLSRQVLIMKYLENMSYKEIADILNIQIRTAQMRAYRARQRLKEILEEGEIHHE
ncbi:MAG: sigma-70 family RNA polymerase sigma factor [Bacillota bacterium]|nr:sigma-70 family RNA polymerase sigma factor [Bacillota bacterium]